MGIQKSKFCVVYVSVPRGKVAKIIASSILKQRLAACVNIVESIESHYWWNKKICKDKESLLIIKTQKKHLKKLFATIKLMHPYQTPEMIALPIIQGHQPYLEWIHAETN